MPRPEVEPLRRRRLSSASRVVALLAVGAAVALLALWFLPPLVTGEADPATDAGAGALASARSAVVAVFAVFTAAFAGYATYRNSEVARRYNEQVVDLNRRSQRADRYTRAVQLIADDDKSRAQTGGIFALEQLAVEAPAEYHNAMIGVLTGFVRDRAPLPTEPSAAESRRFAVVEVQRAVDVLRRRDVGADDERSVLFLAWTDLHMVSLRDAAFAGANLRGARIAGSYLGGADLRGADLREVDATGTRFADADLSGADLAGATLHGADLAAVRGLTREQVGSAVGDRGTKLPDALVAPAGWLVH